MRLDNGAETSYFPESRNRMVGPAYSRPVRPH